MSGIDLIGTLQPKNSGSFPTHDAQYGKGGFQSVADLTARDAIPTLNRIEGMQVYVVANGQTYSLASGLANVDWYSVTGATPQSIVWRPGETSKNGQVATWAEVETWIAASQPAPLLVYVDDSLASCTIPNTANTDCFGVELRGYSNNNSATLNVADGGQLRNLTVLNKAIINNNGTAVSAMVFDITSGYMTLIADAYIINSASATVAAINCTDTTTILGNNNSWLDNSQAPTIPVVQSSAQLVVYLSNAWVTTTPSALPFTAKHFACTGAPALVIAHDDSFVWIPQVDWAGTQTVVRSSYAGALQPNAGTTANRPAAPFTGEMYFDTDGYAAIWWNGANWINTPTASSISAFDIDWSLKAVFTKTLSAGANTFTFSNATSGKIIVVRVTGAASTLTWPTVKWAGGTPPTQTASGTDIYTFIHDGTDIFGSAVQDMS